MLQLRRHVDLKGLLVGEVEDYVVAASGDHHAILVDSLHLALLMEQLLLPSELQHLLQVLSQGFYWPASEYSSFGDEEGEEQINVVAGLY